MMTREEFIQYLAKRLGDKYQSQVTWNDIASAFVSASQVDKDAIASAFVNGDINVIGERVRKVVSNEVLAKALARANVLMADNTMSTDELLEVFG